MEDGRDEGLSSGGAGLVSGDEAQELGQEEAVDLFGLLNLVLVHCGLLPCVPHHPDDDQPERSAEATQL